MTSLLPRFNHISGMIKTQQHISMLPGNSGAKGYGQTRYSLALAVYVMLSYAICKLTRTHSELAEVLSEMQRAASGWSWIHRAAVTAAAAPKFTLQCPNKERIIVVRTCCLSADIMASSYLG